MSSCSNIGRIGAIKAWWIQIRLNKINITRFLSSLKMIPKSALPNYSIGPGKPLKLHTMKTKYQEVVFQRNVNRNSPDQITVSFERIKTIKQVACTEHQAAAFNAGKLTYPNQEFTLLLKDNEPDPEPQIIKYQIARKGGGTFGLNETVNQLNN
jgi:hypothetical protein